MEELEIRQGKVDSPLWTSSEVCEHLGISKRQLEGLRKKKLLNYVNIPGRYRYFRREVEHYGKTLEAERASAQD